MLFKYKGGYYFIMRSKRRILVMLAATVFLLAALFTGCSQESEDPEDNGTDNGESVDSGDEVIAGEEVDYEIQGIDPGAGIMASARQAIEDYGLEGWELLESSDAAMTAALTSAYEDQEPIIITGWTPHWKFSKFDLKYLDDPQF